MKVYKFTPKEAYAGGCILVAAETEEEAKQCLDTYSYQGLSEYNLDGVIENLEYKGDKAEIIVSETYFE